MKEVDSLLVELSEYAMDRIKSHVEELVKSALNSDEPVRIEYPPQGIQADLAIPCFAYAKTMRMAPPKIAAMVVDYLKEQPDTLIEKAEVAGGYLNLTYNKTEFFKEVFSDFTSYGENYGNSLRGAGKTMVLDYSSPNVAKPFSVGNIRSTIIGQAIYNIFKAIGFRSVGINHIGDWGTQFGKLMYAYQLWGDEEKVKANPIKELLALYVRFHQECKEQGETECCTMEDEGRKRFKMLEEGDPEMTRLWKWFIEVSLQDFQKIYDRLHIKFDYILGESFYNDKTGPVLEKLSNADFARREEGGALIIPLEQYGIDTPLLAQRSDGATLYATRELASLLFRITSFNPELLVYCVGGEQKLHFQQAFKVIELMGYSHVRGIHVDFGMVSLKEGKMSTREGRVIFFEDVLQEGHTRALAILEEKRPDLTAEERDKIAEVVGMGAIKFNDLSQNRIKNIVFDWDKMLSFDGDTAPYLQYSYARVQSILRKAEVEPAFAPELLKEKEEADLAKELARYPEVLREAASEFAPHTVAQYLLDTARTFTAFYQAVPVLKADSPDLVKARLALVKSYATVIKHGLSLLGIDVLERM